MAESTEDTAGAAERLEAAAGRLEKAAAWLEQRQAELNGDITKIVATVDANAESRQQELEQALAEAERQIAELKAQAGGRRTTPAAQLLAKRGVGSADAAEAGTLDAALGGLSLEQRVAVKAQLIRSGVLG
jgi:chromosome segregation ATPase